MNVYYNEFDRRKAASLRNLIEEGVIANGFVDERSIAEVQPDDLAGFDQHHFFAGVGLWSLCLRYAGWPDDRPVWTGSPPCGPFSEAGLGKGFDDPRHLWPEWFRLIGECRPRNVFGEQSANADFWIDLVQGDFESLGYAFGATDISAAGFRGAHRRQRFGFVADADNAEWWSDRAPWHDGSWPKTGWIESSSHLGNGGSGIVMGDAGRDRYGAASGQVCAGRFGSQLSGQPRLVGDASGDRPASIGGGLGEMRSLSEAQRQPGHGSAIPWGSGAPFGLVDPASSGCRVGPEGFGHIYQPDSSSPLEWLYCHDGRWRPTEPGLSPLTDAHPARMGQLHSYGDGIDVAAFTNLIAAYLDVAPDSSPILHKAA